MEIVGLYFLTKESIPIKVRMIRYIHNQLYQSPVLSISYEMFQDLKTYLTNEKLEMEIVRVIQSEFKIEDYTLISDSDLQKASQQIEYLKSIVLRDKKINDILS